MIEPNNKPLKINLGCASRPLDGYINVDLDTIEDIKKRYPNISIPEGMKIYNYDIFNMPFKDGSVDLIRADSLLEHLSFLEEKKIFFEIKKLLRVGRLFEFSVNKFKEKKRL